MNESFSKLLTADEASRHLGLTTATLAVWRCTGRYNLPYIKIGSRVRYRLEDIETFLRERTRLHTGDGGDA